ncbi:MAG: hypothetical protein ACXIUL_13575 [Wenzhouxiangella sp.]
MTRFRTALLITLASGLLMACRSEPEPPPEPAAETAPVAQTQPRREVRQREPEPAAPIRDTATLPPLQDPARQLPSLRGELAEDGWGLDNLIDGSSPAAFAQSLELIASDTSERQYQEFNAALRYLQTYSLATRDLPSFYRTLDNLSANEVIERAREQQRARRGR